MSYPFPFHDTTFEFDLPSTWHVHVAAIRDSQPLDRERMKQALARPIGSLPLREMARRRSKAVIIVEDLTRPAPTHLLVPLVVAELEAAGIERRNMQVVNAAAAHRPQLSSGFRRKLGLEVYETIEALNSSPYEDLVYLGHSSRGTPIYVNRQVVEADIRVGVGGIVPHPSAGFGGGAKLILPGVCGMETIAHHHGAFQGAPGKVEDNPFRDDLEEVGRIAGLDFIVNAVITSKREIAGLFTGDTVQAHRAGVQFARQVYAVQDTPPADIGIINAYPLDADLFQSPKALSAIGGGRTVRKGGAILLAAACPEGVGFHAWAGRGGRGWSGPRRMLPGQLSDRRLFLYSPNLSRAQVKSMVAEEVPFFNEFEEAIEVLAREYPNPRVNLFPQGALAQLSELAGRAHPI